MHGLKAGREEENILHMSLETCEWVFLWYFHSANSHVSTVAPESKTAMEMLLLRCSGATELCVDKLFCVQVSVNSYTQWDYIFSTGFPLRHQCFVARHKTSAEACPCTVALLW